MRGEERRGEERRGEERDSLMRVCKNRGGGAGRDGSEDRGEGIGLPSDCRVC